MKRAEVVWSRKVACWLGLWTGLCHFRFTVDGKVTVITTSMLSGRVETGALRTRIGGGGAQKLVVMSALMVASAGLLSIEIASRSIPLLGWFTLLPLLAAIRIFRPKAACLLGAIWGVSLWFFLAMRSTPLVAIDVQSLAMLTLAPAVYALTTGWVTRRYGFNPLILAFGWGAVELSLLPLGLGGGLLGGSLGHEPGTLLHFLQGLLGYVCMAALIVGLNGVALALLGQVYVRACGTRRCVRGGGSTLSRFSLLEVSLDLLSHIAQAQPRAPPVFALSTAS